MYGPSLTDCLRVQEDSIELPQQASRPASAGVTWKPPPSSDSRLTSVSAAVAAVVSDSPKSSPRPESAPILGHDGSGGVDVGEISQELADYTSYHNVIMGPSQESIGSVSQWAVSSSDVGSEQEGEAAAGSTATEISVAPAGALSAPEYPKQLQSPPPPPPPQRKQQEPVAVEQQLQQESVVEFALTPKRASQRSARRPRTAPAKMRSR